MENQFQEFLSAATEIARKAGEEVKAAFQKKKVIELKSSPVDMVTETDKRVETLIISFLKSKFPNHSFIGEETAATGEHYELTENPTWIIDPVDGTTNFVHSFQFVAISIGLAFAKDIVLGVIYNPITDEMFTAVKGQGAHCNGQPITCSKQKAIDQSLILFEIGSSRVGSHLETKLGNVRTLIQQGVHGARSLGSAALNMCQIAKGSCDVYFEYGIHCWDMAAGDIIVREAGGVTSDPSGGPLDIMSRTVLAASTKELADAVSAHLTHITYKRDDDTVLG